MSVGAVSAVSVGYCGFGRLGARPDAIALCDYGDTPLRNPDHLVNIISIMRRCYTR